MPVAIITGSGTHALPGFDDATTVAAETPFGTVDVSRGQFAGVDVLHISRHGAGHVASPTRSSTARTSGRCTELGATAVVGCTVCGAVDPSLELGSLVVFDDLHFIANRLPDGSLCSFFVAPGDPRRGHWVLHAGPFSPEVRRVLLEAAAAAGYGARDGGTYGHVDGPRFNTPAEIAQLAGCGVVAVSQTGGPETVLCGELELPFALVGFVTDYANEVVPGEPTPVATLQALMSRSPAVFADVLAGAVGRLAGAAPRLAGTMFRIGGA